MPIISLSEITPISDYGREKCPFNCVGCEYFDGLIGKDDISCNLPMNEQTEET